ncbi:conjugal transfer protein TraR [Pseudoalteromonas luteoviolacea]|uniref:Conjugal transfer protein TraR n=1 Tax=Pseudoalteromonas luteoviolacea TaxID=43657 RepID=A0A1C0TT90_9GAMM|nr:TraR/DksA C4-type zinc finger protein [Pseudoalteromonas luteoviolacea]MBQ4814104.1 TraR/DksA C4-type zinc finger protein [Pseudoalteromonas luteoviolacea]OCQ22414.1 conjugal transfer protein TraR [Pseudoalteromonas luteoviolacea]
MNDNLLSQCQVKLANELALTRASFIEELKTTSNPITSELAEMLQQISPADWIDSIDEKICPNQFPNYMRLIQIEAAMCQIDIGQFGFCCDCEKEIEVELLNQDPTTQRCKSCQSKA